MTDTTDRNPPPPREQWGYERDFPRGPSIVPRFVRRGALYLAAAAAVLFSIAALALLYGFAGAIVIGTVGGVAAIVVAIVVGLTVLWLADTAGDLCRRTAAALERAP